MNYRIKLLSLIIILQGLCFSVNAENGYKLWLRYCKITDKTKCDEYKRLLRHVSIQGASPVIKAAREELWNGLISMTGQQPIETKNIVSGQTLILTTSNTSPLVNSAMFKDELKRIGKEGYLIKSVQFGGKKCIVVAANTDIGLLYGVFNFLKLLQTNQSIHHINIVDYPHIQYRILDHWDNLDRTVERGYAGFSIWNWHKLPGYIDQRYIDYARADASIGINGVVLNNINANTLSLTPEYLVKTAALATCFRPYGIRVYLSIKFNAPIEIGGLKTADPLDPQVRKWWKDKADEIYGYIPDFGGFLVKASSEGQPGPQTYGRSHAEGANMLADALEPHHGIVMWRAFVYDNKVADRASQAYNEFKPLDGKFKSNVVVQVKNGPIDFQPREPFHPLFGAMPATPLMMEFQITQEYLGFSTSLVYLAPLFKECLESDTYAKGKGSTVARIIDGSLEGHAISGIAGVANIGNDINWCGHPFAQANWYAFGRLAWNPYLSSEAIADDWLRMTFTKDDQFVSVVKSLMLNSRENVVNYMMPLGLHHIMSNSHYGPGPWIRIGNAGNYFYYHKADSLGIGFDRTSSGSDAAAQYFLPVREEFENIKTCPEKYLLWFHHVNWDYKMHSGNTLWNELVNHYYNGADSVKNMQRTWDTMGGKIDKTRFMEVKQLLAIQYQEAIWWRDACVQYFQSFSKRPIPYNYPKPQHSLSYYENLEYRYVN
ncbi:MAG: alpha-glucuronidase family glycosyl hydrolase [Sphingobacteriales bacterium]